MKTKKKLFPFFAILTAFMLSACGGSAAGESSSPAAPSAEAVSEWSRTGYFQNEKEELLYVDKLEDQTEEGWYVMFVSEDNLYGGYLPQDGTALKGELYTDLETKTGALPVTISEDGDGLALAVDGKEPVTYAPSDILERTFRVTINTEGYGFFNALTDSDEFETDEDFSSQSLILSLQNPATYTVTAQAGDGYAFVKWTKDGEDFSTEPEFTMEFSEDAEFIAVFDVAD